MGPLKYLTTLKFSYVRPPLSANQRLHHMARARLVRDVRDATRIMARHIPPLGQCKVTLTWVVADKRRRDADNLVPTLKAMCDGLVDAGVVADDTPDLMHKVMPVIEHEPGAEPHMELRIEKVTHD